MFFDEAIQHACDELNGVVDLDGLGDDDTRGDGDNDPAPVLVGDAALPMFGPPLPPWSNLTPPSARGYVYQDGRCVMRIQRQGVPLRVWANCYLHPSCRVNVPAAERGPTDNDLFRWLFDVEPAPGWMDQRQREALARQHMQLARDRWGLRGRR